MDIFYCKYCGQRFSSVRSMTGMWCFRHPDGPNKGKHAPYEGSIKQRYTCRFCGQQFTSIQSMTGMWCFRHPKGSNKGKHEPAL